MSNELKKRIVIGVVAVAILSLFGYAIYKNTTSIAEVEESPHAELNAKADAVENYVRDNLATLSPEPATMGGTFYVTRIRLLSGEGTVNYEDGHNAYTASFTYSISDDNQTVSVDSFTIVR